MSFLPASPFALFEDNLSPSPHGLLLQQHVLTLDCMGDAQADAFFATLEEHSRAGRWVALIAHYELGTAFETHAPTRDENALFARALIFAEGIALDADALADWWTARLATLPPQAREAGLLHLSPAMSKDDYLTKARRVLDYIGNGDCYQANLTFPMTGEYFGAPLAFAAKLRSAQPVGHGATLFDGEEWLVSRSPELFFERTGRQIICRPMKGTAVRGETAEEDDANGAALQGSEKNRAENLMIVDLIRNDLGRLARAGDVRVRKLFELERYATVFQLTSTIEAGPIDASLGEVFRALFPCGSVTGAPKVRAMQIIHELESQARGPYCGALGWLRPGGDCSFNVPIRTLRLQADGRCRMDVGSGIVADSIPSAEYDECLSKARFVTDDGLQLIETLRCEVYTQGSRDEPYPLLLWHLQRLSRSANALYFAYDEERVREALLDHAATLPLGLQRVRLLLSRDGHVNVSSAPLDALSGPQTLVLASGRIDPDDRRLQHKTTARSFYDEALRTAMGQGHFDVVHLNTRDEICEGARSNIFIERAGQLLTPPTRSGLLPGVMRAQLLAANAAVEAILHVEDLLHAERIFMGNALRGLVEVQLVQ